MGWDHLPVEILVKIYRLLPLKNLGRCSQVCSQWYEVFFLDDTWRTFTFHDGTLVRRQCVPKIIDKWREIIVEPISNLFNLYEFLQKLTNFNEFHERCSDHMDSPLGKVRHFTFKWSLHVKDRTLGGELEEKDIGTGGEVLRQIRAFLFQLHGLKELELHQLQLNSNDTELLLGELLERFQLQLKKLAVPNLSLFPNPCLHLGLFLNLEHLTLSPTNLSDSSVILLADLKHLRNLHIVQDERSINMVPCSSPTWKLFTRCNRGRTRIALILKGKPKMHLMLQPSAPVQSVIFELSAGQLTSDLAEKICYEYGNTLEKFEQGGLERSKRSNLGVKRADRGLYEIATRCLRLRTLVVRERISLGTALLLALQSKENGFRLHLRKNGLLKRATDERRESTEAQDGTDYISRLTVDTIPFGRPRQTSWKRSEVENLGVDFDWLRARCRDYDLAEEELHHLGGPLCLLSDKRYKALFR